MRRKNANEKDNKEQPKRSRERGMSLTYIKICFAALICVSVVVYIYLHIQSPKLPFPMSPEMEAIYKEHGPGEAKLRRRPDMNTDSDETASHKKDDKHKIDDKEELKKSTDKASLERKKSKYDEAIHVGIVACGNRAPEAIISLKSFAMRTKKPLHFHIFAEDDLHKIFKKEIQEWPAHVNEQIQLDIQPIQYPVDGDFNEWKKLFKPCASQRLFFPLLLKDVDAMIYVDTDVVMLQPPEDLWDIFKEFNKTQLAGLAPEGEVDAIGWYNRFGRHPYYGRLGLNSGVMLMNLTRMRRINWNNDVYPIYKRYRYDITWGDQDILNIMFHFKPEQLYLFPCKWNYRPDHCMYGNNCGTAVDHGVAVVHGSRGVFQNEKQPEFKVIYQAFRNTKFGADAKRELKKKIKEGFDKYKSTYCGQEQQMFIRNL